MWECAKAAHRSSRADLAVGAEFIIRRKMSSKAKPTIDFSRANRQRSVEEILGEAELTRWQKQYDEIVREGESDPVFPNGAIQV